uniref:Metallo-beta-lactamase domain-containing protein n=2 Tax=Leersia perrieri TaxID=77586 RepID=A0A0D9Y1G4_9ORYZ
MAAAAGGEVTLSSSSLVFLGTGCSSAVPNARIAQKFPYLVRKKLKDGEEVRRVAQLDWRVIESDLQKPFVTSGLEFVPLPVIHGEDYVCLGFLFGRKSKVAYISDVSRFPPSTEHAISKSGGGQLDLLILDCLYRTGSHNVHLCWDQTLDAVKRICPKRALLIGMTHEMDHHKDNETLEEWSRREGIDVQLAHDGLRVHIDLNVIFNKYINVLVLEILLH